MKTHLSISIILLFNFFCFGQWNQMGDVIIGDSLNDQAGFSIDMNMNGNIIAIGSYSDLPNSTGASHGLIRVFENIGGTWTQIGTDIYGENDQDFSIYTRLNDNGNILAIGGYGNDENGDFSGHVRVFENIGGTWTQIGSNINGVNSGDNSGRSISLNSTGSIIAIGSPYNSDSATESGHVRVFENINDDWIQIGSNIEGATPHENLGLQKLISLNSDGNIIAIASRSTNNQMDSGIVKIFENDSGNWSQIGSDITHNDINYLSVNHALDISSSGNIVAIGSSFGNGIDPSTGRVRIFENMEGTWTQIGTDIYGDNTGDFSGWSVSLNSFGDTIAIGSPYSDNNGVDSGQVRVFRFLNGEWTKINGDLNGQNSFDKYGWSVSLNSIGNTIAIGAIDYDNLSLLNVGEVSVFNFTNILNVNDYKYSNISLYPNPANEFILINFNEIQKNIDVEIFNSLGSFIKSFKYQNTDLIKFETINWTSGIYYLKLKVSNSTFTKKIILKN